MRRTSFWAENIEFMMGMYDEDWSGETDRMRIRGSGRITDSSVPVFEAVEEFVVRLTSILRNLFIRQT